MVLQTLDWSIIIGFFIISMLIGLYASRTAGKSAADYFLSGRNMPWWLLGVSMVATTFSCDTPNLVADIVRGEHGVAGNWVWWAFLLTGMLTVFVYAKLWRRSNVMTDLEFYEIRYGGKPAAFLRGFRAVYLGAFFNILVIAVVSLALIKIGAVMLQWSALKTLLIASTITVIYSAIGGLKGILLTDFFQFIIAMIGSFGAAYVILNMEQVGGLETLVAHAEVVPKLNMLPDFSDKDALLSLLVLPLAVQWWSVWYPGSEPGGGGYIAQRMLSAKNEKGAVFATLFFNVAHYALRPWPWILVALASLIIFPDIQSMVTAFPDVDANIIKDDFAYPAMLSFLPTGLLGLVVASLIAAFMSTASTQLNWGSSYIVNDFYHRFIKPDASDRELVNVGRIATVLLMLFAGLFALQLSTALEGFKILMQVGAGTGLVFILRWFWWRINAYTEISAMVISFLVALYFKFGHEQLGFEALSSGVELVAGVGITSVGWLVVTFMTPATDPEILKKFYGTVRPGGPGWKDLEAELAASGETLGTDKQAWDVPTGILCMLLGCISVYTALFAVGNVLYGNMGLAAGLGAASAISAGLLFKTWGKLNMK